jgi:CheY-like chemotaxis protein
VSRVLIVEDVRGSREQMASLLRMEGYQPVTARNGAEGLVRLKEGLPDLILLDHMMPEVDGLTFLAGIRRFPKWKNIPVIMFSALKDNQTLNKAKSLGVVDYLVKAEYTIPQLLEQIQKHVPQKPVAAA